MTPLHSPPDERAQHEAAHARIVCLSTDIDASASLQGVVSTLLPDARVESADTSILRGVPNADCAVISVGTMYSLATSLVQELRARGFAGAIVVVADAEGALEHKQLDRLGVDARISYEALPERLFDALAEILARRARAVASPQGQAILAALHRTQSLMAAGTIASGLQHRLNNPLAALLAEAQLLELEPLDAEHVGSVRRIVHLCRRVIEVSRSIEGIATIGNTNLMTGIDDADGAFGDDAMASAARLRARMLPEPPVDGL